MCSTAPCPRQKGCIEVPHDAGLEQANGYRLAMQAVSLTALGTNSGSFSCGKE